MDTSRFIICRASAGSGKTYTLVRQYLTLAFDAPESQLPQRFRRILAITFTNKAAGEMKERILREVENIRTCGAACPMGEEIGRLNLLDDSRLRRYAAIVQSAILHNYSDLAVCTIDSFMHRIVRTFARDLGLPLNFDIQLDNDNLIQNAVDELMALAGTEGQEELTEVLCDFAESKMAEGKSYMVEGELARLAEELFKEQTPEYLATLRNISYGQFREFHRQMLADNRQYEQSLRAIAEEAIALIDSHNLTAKDFYKGQQGVAAWFAKMAQGRFAVPGAGVLDFVEGDRLGASKVPATVVDDIVAIKPALVEYFDRIQQLRADGEALYNTRSLLLKNLYALALMGTLDRFVAQYSHDNEVVHISEFNKRIAAVVMHEPAPFIYERLGSRYQNYLIDEFQDTSRLQWGNLVPLVENGVSLGHTSLVVGDGKQAIYRFRQGDVEQFVRLPQVDNPLHGRLLEKPGIGQPMRLECNYRSGNMVVEFNNDFFHWAVTTQFPDNDGMQHIYIGDGNPPDLMQEPVKQGGYVQIAFRALPEGHDELYADMLADLQRLTAECGYHYSDVTVLARNRATLAEVSQYLTEQGVPVVSNESFLLCNSRVVMLLVNLLQCLLDGSDRVAAKRVERILLSLGKEGDSPYAAWVGDGDFGRRLSTTLSHLRQLPLYDCCEEALRQLHLQGFETAYVGTFLNVVARYCQTHREDLAEFLQWFDEQKERLSTATAADLDAVRLMTIHKAKGLETPVMMYPIVNRKERNDSLWVHVPAASGLPLPTGWVQPSKGVATLFDEDYADELLKSELDRINVLYVALTRPKEQLRLYCEEPPKTANNAYNSLLKRYVLSHPDMQEVHPNVYASGDERRSSAAGTAAEASSTVPLHEIVFPTWRHRIAIARQADDILAPADDSARLHGNLLHDLLAHLADASQADSVLSQYLATHSLTDEQQATLRETLHTLLAHPDGALFFHPDHPARRETELIFHGDILRPDRIVETPTALQVVDFKTGIPRPEHRDQVQRYCQAMTDMGYPSVEGYLLYISRQQCQSLRVV